jgi:acetyl-CoA carboxylase biotin carboxylase subunit
LRKILIANRGEIAVRIIRACRDLGLPSVAVFSNCDRTSRHVRMADEAVAIGADPPGESYLRIDRILDAARASGADAVHPGYGFLSENEAFAAACRDAGLVFIGPTPEAIGRMGSKTTARRIAAAAGVPVVPGTEKPYGPDATDDHMARAATRIGYPVLVKAVAGGGGKGMRVVEHPEDLPSAIRTARSEAATAFGDSAVYLERRLTRPRHIEVQILADRHGAVQAFVERECSIQRRHQKVVEESPSPVVSRDLRDRLSQAAVAVAKAAEYTNAGTVEFLLDEDGHFYFLEMNARLQVEHPVTEMVTSVDLVRWQIRLAQGERLTLPSSHTLVPLGHALECRVYAEDPDAGFIPSPGRITELRVPNGPGIRDDSGVEVGSDIPIFYDPLLSKLVSWGEDRAHATVRMRRALDEYEVRGIRTTLPFFKWLLARPEFVEARFHTGFLDELLQQRAGEPFGAADPSFEEVAAVAACLVEASHSPQAVAQATRSIQAPQQMGPVVRGWKARARIEGLRE